MATKYDDIIKIRGGKAAYDISEEKKGEWRTFIPNEQFNNVLRTVIKSVRGNDIDNHKSFWINEVVRSVHVFFCEHRQPQELLDQRHLRNGQEPCRGSYQPLAWRCRGRHTRLGGL